MKRNLTLALSAALLVVPVLGGESACNNVGECPSASSISPGGSCKGDYLECPYTLQTPSPACDGTAVGGGLATSCICTSGAWVCPDPVSCDAGAAEDGAVDGPADAAAGGEAAAETAGGDGEADGAARTD